jgi:hypothetical protein
MTFELSANELANMAENELLANLGYIKKQEEKSILMKNMSFLKIGFRAAGQNSGSRSDEARGNDFWINLSKNAYNLVCQGHGFEEKIKEALKIDKKSGAIDATVAVITPLLLPLITSPFATAIILIIATLLVLLLKSVVPTLMQKWQEYLISKGVPKDELEKYPGQSEK